VTDENGFADIDAARVEFRTAGYCVLCDRIVELRADGGCADRPEHPAAAVTGKLVLGAQDVVPRLSRFNLAAFLIPPIWGPANGQWAGAIFLPIWLFMDSVIASAAGRGAAMSAGAGLIVAATLSAQAWFAKRANGLAWRRIWDRVSVDEFSRRQRLWALAAVPLFAIVIAWGFYYRLVVAS